MHKHDKLQRPMLSFKTHRWETKVLPWDALADEDETAADNEDKQQDRTAGIGKNHIGTDASQHAEETGLHEDGTDKDEVE